MPSGSALAIETDRLLLREVRETDADAFAAYMPRETYWRHLPIDPPTRAWVEASVARRIQEQSDEPRTAWLLAAVLRDTDEVVGEGLLKITDRGRTQGEIGWGLDSRFAGRGLATEIGGAMLALGFEHLGLHRIAAMCRVENTASRRVMDKLGMREEGALREHLRVRGEWWSSHLCSILRPEYEAAGRAPASERGLPRIRNAD
ncbi:MAG TPA: GNAT family protein [Azospirillaceae bacterium]|nr:GNAT family protein [Azospirillaceae bacterium]